MHAALFDGADKGALQRGPGDGCGVDTRGGGKWTAVAPHRRKEPERMAVRAPVRAQERERGVRKRHIAIRAALAVEVERRAIAVDVRHLQADAFHQAQAARVDRREADAVGIDAHRAEDPPHFLATQHHGEFLRPFGTRDVEHPPRLAERLL